MKTMRGACSGHTIPINVRIRRNFWAWRQFNWGIVRGIAGTEETGVTVEKSVTAKKGLTSEKSLTSEEVSYSPKLQARDGGGDERLASVVAYVIFDGIRGGAAGGLIV
jgi:hypothetical protein